MTAKIELKTYTIEWGCQGCGAVHEAYGYPAFTKHLDLICQGCGTETSVELIDTFGNLYVEARVNDLLERAKSDVD